MSSSRLPAYFVGLPINPIKSSRNMSLKDGNLSSSQISAIEHCIKTKEQQLQPQQQYQNDRITEPSEIDINNNQITKTNIQQSNQETIGHGTTLDTNYSEQSDPDVDRGYAFVILAAMFIINASTYGTARAYGLIFEKSVRHDDSSRVEAAIPFTIMGALENMSGPFAGYMLAKFQNWRLTVFIGSALISLAHIFAAIFDSLISRIISLGIICGFGSSLIMVSSFQINNAYFVKYRSRAFGFGLTGAAFGTLYISPLCQWVINTYSINVCYLVLGLILLPNTGLALLLRPKPIPVNQKSNIYSASIIPPSNNPYKPSSYEYNTTETPQSNNQVLNVTSISINKSKIEPSAIENGKISSLSEQESERILHKYEFKLWKSIGFVLRKPIFHLIWMTQLIFCWFNFVFGMIIVDFARDRGLTESELSYLIPVWALGQLVGRLLLGAIADMNFISYNSFTVICLGSIGISTWLLENLHQFGLEHEGRFVILIVLILSIFISNLYILFNGLVAKYIEQESTAMCIGISSFISSFFLLPRAHIIGYYRDTLGEYDYLLGMFTVVASLGALIWLSLPILIEFNSNTDIKTKQSTDNNITDTRGASEQSI